MSSLRRRRAVPSLLALSLLLATLLLVAACAGNDAGEVRDRVDGDSLLAAGDFVGAARAYEREVAAAPDSALLREKLRTARLKGAEQAADDALAAASAGRLDRAGAAMATAERLAPGHAYIRRARAEVDRMLVGDARARALYEQGRAALRDDPTRAADLLAQAREADPHPGESAGLLREATLRSEATRAAARAGAAWDAGDRDRAVRELASAQYGGRPLPEAVALRDVIAFDLLNEAREGDLTGATGAFAVATAAALPPRSMRAIRTAYAGRLVAERDDLLRAGRPALAALYEITAERAGASPGARARTQAGEQARLIVVVPPFETSGGAADISGADVAGAVAGRLNADARGGGLVIHALGPADSGLFASHPAALRLSGTLSAARVATGPTVRTSREVEAVVGVRIGDNPEASEAVERLNSARAGLAKADEELARAREELRRLRSSTFVGGGMDSAGLDKALARQEIEITAALARRETALAAEKAARVHLVRTAPTAAVPVTAPHPVDVETFRRTASVTARVTLTEGARSLLDERITGSAVHDESVHGAVPGAELAADPDESPDTAGMQRLAVDHLARLVAGRVRTVAAAAAERFLTAADRARAAGRSADASEGYSLYLLVTPEGPSQGRQRAAHALREITGFAPAVRHGGPRR